MIESGQLGLRLLVYLKLIGRQSSELGKGSGLWPPTVAKMFVWWFHLFLGSSHSTTVGMVYSGTLYSIPRFSTPEHCLALYHHLRLQLLDT
jgi:hypothetical protein